VRYGRSVAAVGLAGEILAGRVQGRVVVDL
jgi:hypothetical protein